MTKIKKIKIILQGITQQTIIQYKSNKCYLIISYHQKKKEFYSGIQFFQHLNFEINHVQIDSKMHQVRFISLLHQDYLNQLLQIRNKLIDSTQQQIEYTYFAYYQVDYKYDSHFQDIGLPQYGQDLYIQNQNVAYISNMFNYKNSVYFFYSSELDVSKKIVSDSSNRILGYTFKQNSIYTFVPFTFLLDISHSEKQLIPLNINKLLQNICYVDCSSNYCTGIVISPKKIICTKHVLTPNLQNINQQVNIRFYPYKKSTKGYVKSIAYFDYIQIEPSQPQESIQNVKLNLQHHLGQQIITLGFGKFSFRNINFDMMEILPTLQKGIISKIIKHKNQIVYIKTSANLCNGFSGSGIWAQNKLVGMAIFIIKNGNQSLTYHNYSYSCNFLKNYKSFKQFQKYIDQFEKIGMRKYVPKYPSL